jgi:hypothetical protein
MDPHRFDHLARGLAAAGLTRRGLAHFLSGTALVTFLGGHAAATLAKKKGGKKKAKKCKNGAVKCGKTCVNTGNNALHCGQCGLRCGDNRACVEGACQTGCPGDQIPCNALCVDPSDNEEHCGGCNQPCNGELTCSGGQCGCVSGTKCGNQCVDTATNPDHCGACDDPCDDGESCVGGQCNPSGCGPGQRDCGGGLCIPDDDEHCCNLADCGGQFSDLVCDATTHRCECEIAGRGRCSGQFRFACAPCCPGGDFDLGDRCAGSTSEMVCVSQTHDGCRCPDAAPVACTAFNQTKCTPDPNSDSRVCGRFCESCGTGNCCGGLCVSGCGQGTGGSCASGPCGASCAPCEQGSTCCNFGSGSQCYEGMGTICFPP